MDNNDILRRLRYALELNDNSMIKIFGLADLEVSRKQISNWLKKEDDQNFSACNDILLATFLNGFIIFKRGKRDGAQSKPEKNLNNNIILTKLKIALNLKAEDVLLVLEFADFVLSKHELSAFFRKKDHKHYRECKDQVLRNFIKGIELKYREN
jgi:uncharacterized protein YehS (DUF1456 family)